ncbi:hypothetical protein EVAR_51735_1 [Eumeta japonica]|uniref:Uncharacterized protein n=1 Tax=Eumeta variegata TaxID=151549 RepID=A0A4C1XII3_EUMVA|nr:hypothetical protein EVAR_51735_1 [Eumeta japonica]
MRSRRCCIVRAAPPPSSATSSDRSPLKGLRRSERNVFTATFHSCTCIRSDGVLRSLTMSTAYKDKRASEPPESKWALPPMYTRNFRRVTNAACLQHALTCSMQPTADPRICLSTTNLYPND